MAAARPERAPNTNILANQAVRLQVEPHPSEFARLHASNWTPPAPITAERAAIAALKAAWKSCPDATPAYDGYNADRPLLIADASDFEIYRSPNAGHETRRFELISLHHLEVPTSKKLCLDGFLCIGSVRCYVQGLAIQDSSIEGYGDDETASVVSYVQTELAKKDRDYDIWIRLSKPSKEYRRYHDPFIWIAQLAKHVLDFIDEQPIRSVGLDSFRKDFHTWLSSRFPQNVAFLDWHEAYQGRLDFRTGVIRYVEFLYHQAFNLPNAKHLLAQPLWSECMVRGLTAIKAQDQIVQHTIATPDVYNCFKDMYFGSKMLAVPPSSQVKTEQERRKSQLRFPTCQAPVADMPLTDPPSHPYNNELVQVGDVVTFDPTEDDKKFWGAADRQWFAYVQRTEARQDGGQRLFVLYLYRPRETNIFNAKYPFPNELFFSDNCNCTEGELLSSEINGKCKIAWMPSTIPTNSYFVRQTYITQDSAFVTLKKTHMLCVCMKQKASNVKDYQAGDTVYITKSVNSRKLLEPVVIRQIDNASGIVTVRRLLRLARDCSHLLSTNHRTQEIAASELVLTDEYERVPESRIDRRCYVCFVPKHYLLLGQVPFPYNLGGSGDLWTISMGLAASDEGQRLMYLARLPDRFREGPNLSHPIPDQRLKGLSVFSGGGSLDRGLQQGGAVDFQTVVDFSAEAMHTQRANTRDHSQMRYFCGSVDDYLKAALSGKQHAYIALIGAVNFIAAGSPCPGFSSLQQNILSDASMRNASHISTLCSLVDLYRPEYAVLENVVSMASTRVEGQNVLSQLVACLVSMGYQVNQYIMDAWSYGSAQHRSRVFLTIAAPGLEPIIQPWHTHSRPSEDTVGKSLGRLPNGERFGERELYVTPFTHLTAAGITSDLPNIGNGNVQSCVPHPDHRTPYQPGRKDRALLQCIPRQPPGSGYKEAFHLDLIPPSLQKPGKESGKGFRRIKAAGLVPTITTSQSIQDSRNGAIVHWSQDRPVTILEARRTQGWPDEEPIIGSLVEQYKIVGNGVDRKVSFALGLALRQVVEQNPGRRKVDTFPVRPVEETLVEAEHAEDDDDGASVTPNIYVDVPSRKAATVRRSSAAALSERPRSSMDSPESSEDTGAGHIEAMGFDGAADVRDDTPEPPGRATPLPTPVSAPSMLSRVLVTVSNGIGGLAFRAKTSQATTATPEIHGKRGREASEPTKRIRSPSEGHDITAGKRARTSDSVRVPLSEDSKKVRSTRHSGLTLEFQPKNWNKRPEDELAPTV